MHFRSLILAQSMAVLALAQEQTLQSLLQRPELSQLAGLLESSPNVVSLIQGGRDVTGFAPNNDALSALDLSGIEENLTEPAFVPKFYTPNEAANGTGVPAIGYVEGLDGMQIQSGLGARVNVEEGPLSFENGNLFVIDGALTLPVPLGDTARNLTLTTFADSLADSGLLETLNSQDTLTMFAPTNAAFEAIQSILQEAGEAAFRRILQHHAVAVPYYGRDLASLAKDQGTIAFGGGNYTLSTNDDGDIFVNNARVVTSDVIIPNGVLHVIDTVLNPDNATASSPESDSGAAGPVRALVTAALIAAAVILANL